MILNPLLFGENVIQFNCPGQNSIVMFWILWINHYIFSKFFIEIRKPQQTSWGIHLIDLTSVILGHFNFIYY